MHAALHDREERLPGRALHRVQRIELGAAAREPADAPLARVLARGMR